jgi:hypothetical protein
MHVLQRMNNRPLSLNECQKSAQLLIGRGIKAELGLELDTHADKYFLLFCAEICTNENSIVDSILLF